MNCSIFVVFGCLLVIHLVSSLPYISDGQMDIISGNCTHLNSSNLVHNEHIHKTSIPFVKRDATDNYQGDLKIYCLKAISLKDESKGSTAWISAGGVNHSFATIEMESGRGHGLEYNITIYAV